MTDHHHDHAQPDDAQPGDPRPEDVQPDDVGDTSAVDPTAEEGFQDDDRSLEDQIDRLREDVDFLLLTQHGMTTRSPILDTSWQAMSSARALEAWYELIDWVDEFVERYALDETIPVCWYAHGAMLEELHALHQAWLGAYTGRPEPADRAIWHDLLDRVLHRIRNWNRHGCTPGTHRPDQPAEPSEAELTARFAYVHRDLRTRERASAGTPDAR